MTEAEYAANLARLTPRQREALWRRAFQSWQEAAFAMGIGRNTFHKHLQAGYAALGVWEANDALAAVGWLRIPEVMP